MHMIDVMNKLKEIAESGYDNEDIQRGIDAAATQKFDEESVMKRGKQKKMKREDQKLDNDEQDEEDIHPEWEAALAAAAKKRANDPTVKANDAAEKAFGGNPLYDPEGKPQFSSNWKPIRKPKPKNSDVAVDAVEEVHEEVEEDTSLADMLRLAGRSGVMGMNQNNLLSESVYHELDEADLEEARYETDEVKAIIAKHLGTARPLTDADMDNSELHQDLYDYFVSSGDMPYGTAKARDDDPYEWIFNRLDQLGMVESVTEAEEVEEEAVEEVHEDVEEDTSLADILKLAGRSGVMGMSQGSVIIAEGTELDEAIFSENMQSNARDEAYQLAEDGLVSWKNLAIMCLLYMSNDDVADMLDSNELSNRFGDDEVDRPYRRRDEVKVDEASCGSKRKRMSALSELMRLAGYENYQEKVEEYANDPQEEYMDTEDQLIGLSGGMNGPKKMYPAAAGGDNPMDQEPREIEEAPVAMKNTSVPMKNTAVAMKNTSVPMKNTSVPMQPGQKRGDDGWKPIGAGGDDGWKPIGSTSKANNQELDIAPGGNNKPQTKIGGASKANNQELDIGVDEPGSPNNQELDIAPGGNNKPQTKVVGEPATGQTAKVPVLNKPKAKNPKAKNSDWSNIYNESFFKKYDAFVQSLKQDS